jgi:hypothetical protein
MVGGGFGPKPLLWVVSEEECECPFEVELRYIFAHEDSVFRQSAMVTEEWIAEKRNLIPARDAYGSPETNKHDKSEETYVCALSFYHFFFFL